MKKMKKKIKLQEGEVDGKETQELSQQLLPATFEEALEKYPSDHHPCCPQPQNIKPSFLQWFNVQTASICS